MTGSNERRDTAGVVVTMRRRSDDEPVTVTRSGMPARAALASLLVLFDSDAWYLSCVSTPRTILADLRGRKLATGSDDYARRPGGVKRSSRVSVLPENSLLGQVGAMRFAR